MSDVLVVLHPREISECISALEELPIDKLWLGFYTEGEIEEIWANVLELCEGYERMILVSDDTIPRTHALEAVQSLLDEGNPVVTGYCNLAADNPYVNLTDGPLGPYPARDAYHWLKLSEAMESVEKEIPTWFAGFCLTGMSVEMWTEFPYQLHEHGNSADFQLAKRLTAAKIPMVAHRDAFVYHVKENWNRRDIADRKKLLIGKRVARMDLDRLGVAA